MGAIGSAWACCRRVSSTAAIPPRRSTVRNDLTQSDSFWLLLDFEIDEIAISVSSRNQGIDGVETSAGAGGVPITAHEAIFLHADVESGGASVFDRRRPVFLDQGMHPQDAADAGLCFLR